MEICSQNFLLSVLKTEFLKKVQIIKKKVKFNFFNHIKVFRKSETTKKQKELIENIICFKNDKDESNEYVNLGEFDLIIDSIKGEYILIQSKINSLVIVIIQT